MPNISVIFASYNGEKLLPRVLEAYSKVKTSDITWEIIAVNNLSTDRTRQVLETFRDLIPINIIDCPTPGKNRALNTALDCAKGDFFIFTDDDAIPDEGFIEHWWKICCDKPEFDLFGGAIEPLFDLPPPKWMETQRFHYAEIFAERRLTQGAISAREIFGPNMAVRQRVFEQGIRFNEDIGPNGSTKDYPMGSETEFCTRLERLGFRAYFASAPKVFHIVRPNQISKEYWLKRAYKHGLGFGLQRRIGGNGLGKAARVRMRVKSSLYRIASFLPVPTAVQSRWIWEAAWLNGFAQS